MVQKTLRLLQVAYIKLAMFLYKDGTNGYPWCKFILGFVEKAPEILELINHLMIWVIGNNSYLLYIIYFKFSTIS